MVPDPPDPLLPHFPWHSSLPRITHFSNGSHRLAKIFNYPDFPTPYPHMHSVQCGQSTNSWACNLSFILTQNSSVRTLDWEKAVMKRWASDPP